MQKLTLIALLLVSPLLGGCVVAAVGAGAGVGVAAAQEGGLTRAYDDLRIQSLINEAWFAHDVNMFSNIDMTVSQGRVLLTGVVEDPEHRVEAVRLAWQPDGVKQVINEIRVSDPRGFGTYAKDTWITTRLRSAITIDGNIQSINYSIDTVNGTVYLLGVAQNQKELDRVVESARKIPGVNQVVSYAKLKGEDIYPSEGGGQPAPADNASYQDPVDTYQSPPPSDNSFYQDPAGAQPPSSGGYDAYGAPTDIQAEPLADPYSGQ
jgi:osmotically-inducible protein OsmY